MKLYLVTANESGGYGTFSGFIVVAADEEIARRTFPSPMLEYTWSEHREHWESSHTGREPHSWPRHIENVTVECIGTADASYTKTTVLLSDFHAG